MTAASGAALYQDERFGQGTFGYDFAVANGRCLVTLKFAEISIETTGQRLFHVDLNGTRVLTNFDVYAAAGGPRKAVDRAFAVDVTDSHVRLNFTSVASTATVSAIEIAGGKTAYTQVRTWTYDPATQRLSSVTMPETGTTSYSYYDSGLVRSKTDANGVRKDYTYDSKQRVTQVSYAASGAPPGASWMQPVTYSYDTNPYDGSFTQYGTGRLTAVRYGLVYQPSTATQQLLTYTATEMYSYTPDGRLQKKRMQVVSNGNTPAVNTTMDLTYAFDAEGRVSAMTYPSGAVYHYTYDGMGRLNGMTDTSQNTLVSNVTYGQAGEMLTYGTESRFYNALGQLTSITTPYPGQMNIDYRYSATANNGQILSQKDNVSGEEIQYAYDDLGRLASATTVDDPNKPNAPKWGLGFSYDGRGNRLEQRLTKTGVNVSVPTPTYSYDAATNRLTGRGYTAGGNLITDSPTQMVYDGENRLVAIGPWIYGDLTAAVEYYGYAPDNRRVYRRVLPSGHDVYTLWLYFWAGGQLIGEYEMSPNVGKEYAYFGARRVGQSVDRLGLVKIVFGGGTGSGKYLPYGEDYGANGASGFNFATYYRQGNTGLLYADQRWYSSTLGRFLTADPYQASGVWGVRNRGINTVTLSVIQ